jgi:predicted nucleotide-binding protein (sugar kinase/HSP70/actin superfamily)
MGQLSVELVAATLRGTGVNAEAMPVPDTFTLQMAKDYMSGKECLPSQLVLGSALTYFSSDKYSKDELYLLFVPSTLGPCRTGQYFVFYENLFRDLELDNVGVITMDSENSYTAFGPDFTKNVWRGMVIADYMKDIETTLRTCAVDPEKALAVYDDLWRQLISVTEEGKPRKVFKVLRQIVRDVKKIPLKRQMKDTPKVLVVGEIYVRRDDFAVDELVRIFARNGIIAKVSSVSEWVYYCDFLRKHNILKKYRLLPPVTRLFSAVAMDYLRWKAEHWYKGMIERKVLRILNKTGLVPNHPMTWKRSWIMRKNTSLTVIFIPKLPSLPARRQQPCLMIIPAWSTSPPLPPDRAGHRRSDYALGPRA